jgi:hypothetical protein
MTFSSRSRFYIGMPPSELWGVQGTRTTRKRGDAAKARRAAKRAAKRMGVRFKFYLREQAKS